MVIKDESSNQQHTLEEVLDSPYKSRILRYLDRNGEGWYVFITVWDWKFLRIGFHPFYIRPKDYLEPPYQYKYAGMFVEYEYVTGEQIEKILAEHKINDGK